jgi:uncharacterized protein YndB with AHSA1/START domain
MSPTSTRSAGPLAVGLLAMLALYGIAVWISWTVQSHGGPSGPSGWGHGTQVAYGTAAFFMAFTFAGFIVGIASSAQQFRNAVVALVLCLVPLVLARLEGVVCIVMSLPLVLPELLLGAWLGFKVRKWAYLRERGRLGLMALAFVLSAGWELQAGRTNDPAQHPLHRVETTLALRAAPDRIFAALQDIEVHRAPPAWLRIGLPIPRHMRVVRPGLGGAVRFDHANMTVDAEITAWEPGRHLAFRPIHYDIYDRPFFRTRLGSIPGLKQDPVTDWMTFEEMSYDLTPLPDGGTQLTRTSLFRWHLFPDLYFGWLEPLVIRKGQAHLLECIREIVDGNDPLLSMELQR